MSTVFAGPEGLRKDSKNKVDFEAMWVMEKKTFDCKEILASV
jgi:hypothetical protein